MRGLRSNLMDMFVSLLLTAIVGLCYCDGNSSTPVLGQPHLYGPHVALVKKAVNFYCELSIFPNNETILLQLYKAGDRSKLLGEYSSPDGVGRGVFPILIKASHDGNLECVAKVQNNTKIKPTVSNHHRLEVIEPVKNAEVLVPLGQREFFEGKTLELQCKPKTGSYVTYKWMLNGQPVVESQYRYFKESYLKVNRTSFEDSGHYICIAQNSYNQTIFSSNSSDVVINVKDVVSPPEISFTVVKKNASHYFAVVSCHSTRGTPPVNFSLYNTEESIANATVDDRNATFIVPIVLEKHLGLLQCQADNGDQTAYSQWMPFEVVPVGGPVTIDYDYDIGQNYAVIGVRLYCKASKGTHPQFEWFLNKTLLHGRGSFYYVVDEPPQRSILLLAVGRSSAGTYHCQVSDNFDNTTAISSKPKYMDKEVLNRIPGLVVGIVLGCFAVIIVVVSVCCGYGIVYRRRMNIERPLFDVEMKNMISTSEDELDLNDYTEDADSMKEDTAEEFDQASQESVDDWLWLKSERTAMLEQEEDELVLLL